MSLSKNPLFSHKQKWAFGKLALAFFEWSWPRPYYHSNSTDFVKHGLSCLSKVEKSTYAGFIWFSPSKWCLLLTFLWISQVKAFPLLLIAFKTEWFPNNQQKVFQNSNSLPFLISGLQLISCSSRRITQMKRKCLPILALLHCSKTSSEIAQ